MEENHCRRFFEEQFRHQVAAGDLQLNPFERRVLPYVEGRVLDFGCGLGNLAVAAARRGCSVLALDASATATAHVAAIAANEGLDLVVERRDLRIYDSGACFDTVVSIGLLMFFDRSTALRQLQSLVASVRAGGVLVLNVLIRGTTYLEMFDQDEHFLFAPDEVRASLQGFEILEDVVERFAASAATEKVFLTIVARKKPSA